MLIEGIGLVKFSGTSWSSWNGIKKACGAYYGNGCATFALCWIDIAQSSAKHKNFGLTFRPIEHVPVGRFVHFAPGAAALKAAFATPEEPQAALPKPSASEITGDSVDDVSPPPAAVKKNGKKAAKEVKQGNADKWAAPWEDEIPDSI